MSETIQMRTTDEQSGDYRTYAAKNDEPVKGLAIHNDLVDRLDSPEYVAVTFEEGGAIELEADKFTGSTFRVANLPSVRHAYVSPQFAAAFGMDDIPTEETFDVEGFPSIGISDLESSDEETYDADDSTVTSAEEAADALFGESDDDSDEEAEAEDEEEAEISDEEIGIVDN